MKLAQLLDEQRIFLELSSQTCHEVMQELVGYLDEQGALQEVTREVALEALHNREDEISTGVGCGVAIPHAYVDDLAEPLAIFGRSAEGVEFASCDNAPVRFVILLLIPEDKRGQHLLTLADIGKRFLSCEVRESLAQAQDRKTVLEVLTQ